MPTFWPTQNCVPRWRTTIVPERTNCPSERLTPSRFDSLSRPLRELPTPFLWAMTLSFEVLALVAESGVDRRDRHPRQRLAMAGATPVPLLRLVLEDDDFRTAILLLDLCLDGCPGQQRRADPGRAITADHEYSIKRDVCTRLDRQLLDRERVSDRNPVLLAAGFDDGI